MCAAPDAGLTPALVCPWNATLYFGAVGAQAQTSEPTLLPLCLRRAVGQASAQVVALALLPSGVIPPDPLHSTPLGYAELFPRLLPRCGYRDPGQASLLGSRRRSGSGESGLRSCCNEAIARLQSHQDGRSSRWQQLHTCAGAAATLSALPRPTPIGTPQLSSPQYSPAQC